MTPDEQRLANEAYRRAWSALTGCRAFCTLALQNLAALNEPGLDEQRGLDNIDSVTETALLLEDAAKRAAAEIDAFVRALAR